MNRIYNKDGPNVDVGFGIARQPRDGIEQMPCIGIERMPRDGIEHLSRDMIARKPRDKTILQQHPILKKDLESGYFNFHIQ